MRRFIISFGMLLSLSSILVGVEKETWEDFNPRLDKLLEMEKRGEGLPDSSWFGEDKKDNRERFEELLNQAVGVLAGSTAGDIRIRIDQCQEEIRQLRSDIAAYQRKALSAPERSLFKISRSGYESRIEDARSDILEKELEIEELREDFAAAMEAYGLEMDDGQIDLLLNSVLGDDIVSSIAVYDNVKTISSKLMELTQASREDLEISRRYYAMHVILLELLLQMQSNFVVKIDDSYLPRVDEIRNEVKGLQRETRSLLRETRDESAKNRLRANADAQELTLKTADLYDRHLREQREKMNQARKRTAGDLAVARNTLRTVVASGELVRMIRDTRQSFEMLSDIQVPDLLIFDNLQMKEEFSTLSERIDR